MLRDLLARKYIFFEGWIFSGMCLITLAVEYTHANHGVALATLKMK
jgi:hypothetical protein